ncbi:S-layer homology domain-containing protein [Petroclostridium sp. X23]|uniref:S-layer homology domain-containing protein n=1 Tax=Petroclostridium sp. X23 TaxID=3045146 RepID=UPI0024ACE43B|nr:S-layer homology domain-containing protein [Petroclostridium sp. X23]WHH61773.1 S-layer homology domain-containing protein [Petroclostridium sp. X23]
MKRMLSFMLIFMIVISIQPVYNVYGSSFPDVEGHWAAELLGKWASQELISGYEDGTMRPDQSVTRAEMAKIVNSLFGFMEMSEDSFTDVQPGAWYSAELKKAKKAGFMTGYPGNFAKPDEPVSREQAAVFLSRVFNLVQEQTSQVDFKDNADIHPYAQESVEAFAEKGIVRGYPDGTFRPSAAVTRAELVKMIDGLVNEYIYKAGPYSDMNIEGNAIINIQGVALSDTVVKGDLYLTAGIGEGEVTLRNVHVYGNTYVSGGGENTVAFEDCTFDKDVSVRKDNGSIHVILKGRTKVPHISMKSGGFIENGNGTEAEPINIVIEDSVTPQGKVKLKGCFSLVETHSGARITVARNSIIQRMIINAGAIIEMEEGAVIKEIVVSETANGTAVTGSGTILRADIAADGVFINNKRIGKGNGIIINQEGKTSDDLGSSGGSQDSEDNGNNGPLAVAEVVYAAASDLVVAKMSSNDNLNGTTLLLQPSSGPVLTASYVKRSLDENNSALYKIESGKLTSSLYTVKGGIGRWTIDNPVLTKVGNVYVEKTESNGITVSGYVYNADFAAVTAGSGVDQLVLADEGYFTLSYSAAEGAEASVAAYVYACNSSYGFQSSEVGSIAVDKSIVSAPYFTVQMMDQGIQKVNMVDLKEKIPSDLNIVEFANPRVLSGNPIAFEILDPVNGSMNFSSNTYGQSVAAVDCYDATGGMHIITFDCTVNVLFNGSFEENMWWAGDPLAWETAGNGSMTVTEGVYDVYNGKYAMQITNLTTQPLMFHTTALVDQAADTSYTLSLHAKGCQQFRIGLRGLQGIQYSQYFTPTDEWKEYSASLIVENNQYLADENEMEIKVFIEMLGADKGGERLIVDSMQMLPDSGEAAFPPVPTLKVSSIQ